MAVTYAVNTTSTEITVGTKFTAGSPIDTYVNKRGYMKFDLSSYGLTVDGISSVLLRVYVNAVAVDDVEARLRSATTVDNWGSTLQANATDWNSTDAYIEDETLVLLSTTGFYEWTVDKTHLNLSGITYFRMATTDENGGWETMVFYSQNYGTAAYRPVLDITLTSGRRIMVIS
jgi:hypothetical protein